MVGHVDLPVRDGAERQVRPTAATDSASVEDIRYTITEPEFQVESYLRHQAESFVRRFDANTYLYVARALTYFDLARNTGGGVAHAGACSA